MATFEVAHFKEQGQNVIAVVVSDQFGRKTAAEKGEFCKVLQLRANRAGLAGTVVPVWNQNGRLGSYAPTRWHPFFRSINLRMIAQNINYRLTLD